jgi:Spy/CpxP family protein refolding chaperone
MRVIIMRSINFIKTSLLVISAFAFTGVVTAQDTKPTEGQPQDVQRPASNQPEDTRGNMLRQLGLSREQIQQIRRLNAERKPLMDEAQKRFREANRALDEAIYADNVSDADVQARLKDVHLAQSEVVRIRSMNELAVRRILTPEQLVHFRDLRQRFEQAARENNMKNRQPLNGERGVNRELKQNGIKNPQGGQPLVRPAARPNQARPDF